MKKLKLFISVMATILIATAAMTATAADELRIVYNVGVAPLKFEDAASRPAGLFPDFWRLWAQKAGKKIEFVKAESFKESLRLLKDGKADMHAGLFRTPEREKFLDYSEQLLALDYYIFTHPSVYPIKSLEKTSGFIVGIQKGGYTEHFVRSKVPANRIAVYDRFQDLFRAALEGEIRVFVATELSLLYYLKENLQTNIFEYDRDHPLYSQVYYTATKKGNPALIQAVNDGLKAIGDQDKKLLEDKWILRDFKDIPQESAAALPEKETLIALSAKEKAWLIANPTIRFTGDPDWLPQEAFTSEGQYVGIVADILDLLEARLGILFERVPVKTWTEAVRLAEAGDVHMLSETTSSERETMTFTEPYLVFPVVIIAKQGTQPISDPGELKGKRVAVVKGYGYVIPFRRQYPDLGYVAVETVRDGLMRLSASEVDAFISAAPTAYHLMSELGLTNLRVIGSTGLSIDLGFGVRKDTPVLVGILNKALASITDEEKFKIRQKWVPLIDTSAPQTAVPVSYSRLLVFGIVVFLALSLLAWILIKTIQKEHIAVNFGSSWFRRIVLAGLSIFVIIVCLLSWFTLERNKEKILADVGENLTENLKTADDRLNLWVEQRTSFLKLQGRDPELVTLTKRLLAVPPDRDDLMDSDALRDVRVSFENKDNFLSNTDFFIINVDSINIGSVRDAPLGTRNFISIRKPDLLRRAFEGEVLFVPPIQSDDPAVKEPQLGEAGKPSTKFFIGPIWDPNEQIIAAVALRVDPSKDFSRILPSSETRKTAETYAFSEHGELLSESRFVDQLRQIGLIGENQRSALNVAVRDPGVNLVKGQRPEIERSQQPLTRMASSAIQLKRDMEKAGRTYGRSKIEIDTKGYRDYRGMPVFGAWLWNADLGFGLATEIDVAEAMSNYYQMRWTVFGVLGFTLFLSVSAVLLVLILGERTSRALRKSQDELELRVQERTAQLRKLSQATENSPASVVVTDKNGTIEYVNPTFSEVTGYSAEEAIGQNPKVFKSGDLPESFYKELWDTILSGKVWRGEFINKRKNGEEFWESASISPILNDEGEITHFVAVKQDTTERKKMETALLAERERLQKILDTSPVGVGISTEGVVRFANPQFPELFFSRKGEHAQEAYVNPKDREYIVKELERTGIVRDYELQTYGRDREIRDTLTTFIRTEYEGQRGILSWMVDLSGLKEAERELKAKFDELARFRRLAIGREQKMIELKKEINDLLTANGLSGKYKIH